MLIKCNILGFPRIKAHSFINSAPTKRPTSTYTNELTTDFGFLRATSRCQVILRISAFPSYYFFGNRPAFSTHPAKSGPFVVSRSMWVSSFCLRVRACIPAGGLWRAALRFALCLGLVQLKLGVANLRVCLLILSITPTPPSCSCY